MQKRGPPWGIAVFVPKPRGRSVLQEQAGDGQRVIHRYRVPAGANGLLNPKFQT